MSVPPLVCSTPPPPDQVEEEGYNDEVFSFNYSDLSPTHQFEAGEYPAFDTPSPRAKTDDVLYVSSPYTPSDTNGTFQQEHKVKSSKGTDDGALENNESSLNPDTRNDTDTCKYPEEENNIEDLDLKLDSLHIDFDNDRVTVEDSLNSTFDDFGTFLANTDFIPKIETVYSESEKDYKSQGTCSEESTSLNNEDWDNISQNSFNSHLNTTVTDSDDGNYIHNNNNNNDNIPKDTSTLSSPDDIITSCIMQKEESIDSGFKSSVDDHLKPKVNQSDCKGDIDVSITDTNTYGLSESDELDKITVEKEEGNEAPVDIPEDEGQFSSSVDNKEQIVDDDDFGSFAEARIDFKTSFDEAESKTTLHNVVEGVADFDACNESSEWEIPTSLPEAQIHLDDKFSNTKIDTIESQENEDFGSLDFKAFSNEDVGNSIEGDFTEFKCESLPETGGEPVLKSENVSENLESKSALEDHLERKSDDIEDDDFGDFDTYDPSVPAEKDQSLAINEDTKPYTVNDLVFSTDADIIEILSTAIAKIYQEDGAVEQSQDDHELLSSLGGNWKHLKDYETKQSYLFPWNNSTSQKTLLKSLGIDSRNILFGPKWNTNMPRFAANLGTSPLQPIKQTVPTTTAAVYQHEDKTSGCSDSSEVKDGDTYTQQKVGEWQGGENFTMGDSQASSYAESLLLDLEHLMATLDQMTSGQSPHFKISDLFTNACNEREDEHISNTHSVSGESGDKYEKHQPPSILNIGRKINLPDTHIFTPTDSETPWSHTIHYQDTTSNYIPSSSCNTNSEEVFPSSTNQMQTTDIQSNNSFDDFQSHTVQEYTPHVDSASVIPQAASESLGSNNLDTLSTKNESKTVSDESNSNEFDDFGDFHSATTVDSVVHQTEIMQPISVLQPVKVTPSVSVPLVNWPAPGDVDTSMFDQLSHVPTTLPTLPSWVESHEKPSWMTTETKTKPEKFQTNDLHIPPFVPKPFSPGPKSFILKETKIDSVTTDDNVIASGNTHTSNTDLDDFTEFQSVSSVSVANVSGSNCVPVSHNAGGISTTHISNNIAESVFMNDTQIENEFDDFQSVRYHPPQSVSNQMNTSTFISSPQVSSSFISSPQMPNYFLPSTLSGSFLKNDPSQNFSSMPHQQQQEVKNTAQQILQPLSLENYSQINWPSPGLHLQDLSRFNPINSIHTYSEPKETKGNNPQHSNDDDGWSDFVSIKTVNQPTKYLQHQQPAFSHNLNTYTSNEQKEEDDWSDFVSGTVLPSRGASEVKTISQNIHSHYSQTSNNTPGGYTNRNPHQQNLPSSKQHTASSLTALPHLSYASSKVNSKSNFQNL